MKKKPKFPKWTCTNKRRPPSTLDLEGALFFVSDGEGNIGIRRWVNDPYFDVDEPIHDGLDRFWFSNVCGDVDPNYWIGPVKGSLPLHLNERFQNKVVPEEKEKNG